MSKLETNTIDTVSGTTNLTIGSTNTSTITMPNGALSGQNYPAFEATRTADQTLTSATITKVEFNVENLDTDNCYDATTNYRFLPTLAGKYFVYTVLRGDSAASSQGEYVVGYIYKNGTAVKSALVDMRLNPGRQASVALNAILDMNGTTDYIESYINFETTGSTAKAESASGSLTFGAYRIGA